MHRIIFFCMLSTVIVQAAQECSRLMNYDMVKQGCVAGANNFFEEKITEWFSNRKKVDYYSPPREYEPSKKLKSFRAGSEQGKAFSDVFLLAIKMAAWSDRSNNTLRFLLYCELNNASRYPSKIFTLNKECPHNNLLCMKYIKEEAARNRVYKGLTDTLIKDPIITTIFYASCYSTVFVIAPLISSYTVTINDKIDVTDMTIDVTPGHNSPRTWNQRKRIELTETTIDEQFYGLDIRKLVDYKNGICLEYYNYYVDNNNIALIASLGDKQRFIFPLLPKKGDNLMEHLFLESFLSFNYSGSNSYHLSPFCYSWTSVHTQFKNTLDQLQVSPMKKDFYDSFIDSNIVVQDKYNAYKYSVVKKIYDSYRYIFGSIGTVLLSYFTACYYFYNVITSYIFHYMVLAFPLSCCIGIIPFYLFDRIITHYAEYHGIRYISSGGADMGHQHKKINKTDITLTKNKDF